MLLEKGCVKLKVLWLKNWEVCNMGVFWEIICVFDVKVF